MAKAKAKDKTYTVYTPNKHFTGQRNGVQFTDGRGQASKEQAIELVGTWGYSCPALAGETPKSPKGDLDVETVTEIERPAKKATNEELQAWMDEREIPYETDDNKASLNAKIEAWIARQL